MVILLRNIEVRRKARNISIVRRFIMFLIKLLDEKTAALSGPSERFTLLYDYV